MKRIRGALRHYSWGRSTAIAEIRGVEPSGRPEAEYWLGAHPRDPSWVVTDDGGDGPSLDAVIAAAPEHWLGSSAVDRFGELPFLLKILAAGQPLSIQAHPNAAQAQAGFDRENLAGVDQEDIKRNYRDPNHKPELICALSPFEAKCGFRELDDSRRLFSMFTRSGVDELRTRLTEDEEPSLVLGGVVSWLLNLDQGRAADLVEAVVAEAQRLLSSPTDTSVADFRGDLEWTVRINDHHPGDVGVVVALLLNQLTLQPGEALFVEAGVIHAYLTGVAVEIMANSDNVLRCGLTPKHIDVDELLSVASFAPGRPVVQAATGPTHRFDSPTPEFALTVYRPAGDGSQRHCRVEGPEIVFVESGSATLTDPVSGVGRLLRVSAGVAVAIPAATGGYELELVGPEARVWRATVGR